jgi:hypothetical protein
LSGKRNSFDVFKLVIPDHFITDPERGYNRKKTAPTGAFGLKAAGCGKLRGKDGAKHAGGAVF